MKNLPLYMQDVIIHFMSLGKEKNTYCFQVNLHKAVLAKNVNILFIFFFQPQ